MSVDHKAEAQKWFVRGDKDEEAARFLIKSEDHEETVCFLIQQWVEKYLKGYLAWHKQKLEKTHDLERLLNLCAQLDKDFSRWLDEILVLNDYYIATRYPIDIDVAFKSEEALPVAEAVVNVVKKKLNLDWGEK